MQRARLQIPECPPPAVAALRLALGVGDALAQTLVRRGLSDPRAASEFLDAKQTHPAAAFDGIEHVLDPIVAQLAAGGRITVHGDYDVDGVCATALLVGALRRLGGQVDWHIPERSAGYGLREGAVRALAQRGTSLLITVDCGVASVMEVALANSLGMQVVLTDHHAPRADGALPAAPLLHPGLCRYPCPHLCGTAVAYKLACALWAARHRDLAELDSDLDLVALASIADVVELTGENRTLVATGLRALAATTRPGLRALMEVAGVDPARLDARAVGFGLAPRINAPGRLFTAAPSLELLMTEDPRRGTALAQALDRCNRERRQIEQRILFEAEAQVRQLGPMPGYVLAGEGWHPGVVGIVASRIAERCNRPALLLGLDGATGRGSGRSIQGFDLLAGLRSCEAHLLAYGGHRAACGLEVQRERLGDLRAAFAAYAEQAISADDLVPRECVDAVVSVPDLGLGLAEELSRLAPFGRGNTPVCLLIRRAQIAEVKGMGEGKHARFRVLGQGAHAAAVSFGTGSSLPVSAGEPVDATFTLEVNEWRGVCEPRLVLRRLIPAERRAAAPAAPPPASHIPTSDAPPSAPPTLPAPALANAAAGDPEPLQLALAVP